MCNRYDKLLTLADLDFLQKELLQLCTEEGVHLCWLEYGPV
jgi:hypothetical protein